MHDPSNNVILPLSEFHTTRHSSANIELYLHKINHLLESNMSNNYLPKLIVSDFSWASIDAILVQFMKCDVNSYLTDCYRYLTISNFNMKSSTKVN